MRGPFARVLLAGVVIIGALLAGSSLRQAREQANAPLADGSADTALSAGSPSPSPAAGRCDPLAQVTPVTVPALAVVDPGDGRKRVTSAEAGYEIVVPSAWPLVPGVLGQAAFGQAHITSYDPAAAPTPDPERRMLPPDVGVSFDIQLWANPLREPLSQYAQRVHIGPDQIAVEPGTATTIGGQPAYGFTIRDRQGLPAAERRHRLLRDPCE